jgi:hypothetical protein
MAAISWVDKAINEASFVLERIDRKWPTVTTISGELG